MIKMNEAKRIILKASELATSGDWIINNEEVETLNEAIKDFNNGKINEESILVCADFIYDCVEDSFALKIIKRAEKEKGRHVTC